MKTKIEIASVENGANITAIQLRNVIDEYAEQMAIEFNEWTQDNMYSRYFGSSGENNGKWYKAYTPPSRKYYTGSELYQEFLNQNNK